MAWLLCIHLTFFYMPISPLQAIQYRQVQLERFLALLHNTALNISSECGLAYEALESPFSSELPLWDLIPSEPQSESSSQDYGYTAGMYLRTCVRILRIRNFLLYQIPASSQSHKKKKPLSNSCYNKSQTCLL